MMLDAIAEFLTIDPIHQSQSDPISNPSPVPSITNTSSDRGHPITGEEEENGSIDSTLPNGI